MRIQVKRKFLTMINELWFMEVSILKDKISIVKSSGNYIKWIQQKIRIYATNGSGTN